MCNPALNTPPAPLIRGEYLNFNVLIFIFCNIFFKKMGLLSFVWVKFSVVLSQYHKK